MINVSRQYSGGVFNGLFGNPKKERVVSEQYRVYFRGLLTSHPKEVEWLKAQMAEGCKLWCAGCGFDSPTCHARIIEQELQTNKKPPSQPE